jgi:hypothetical protein
MEVDDIGAAEEALEEAPPRAARFLHGIGAVPMIRTALRGAGMKEAHIAEGRALLLACLAQPLPEAPEGETEQAKAQRAAVAELDAWDEPNFARYSATLKRNFPAVHGYVFKDLAASTGPQAVKGVATFLARVAALKDGTDPKRAGSERKDREAVLLLDSRGLTAAERARLQALVDVALAPTAPPSGSAAESEETRLRKLDELRAWYDEWAAAARAVLKKKGYIVRLGLASRRPPRKAKEALAAEP